jgi:hypothetical protein
VVGGVGEGVFASDFGQVIVLLVRARLVGGEDCPAGHVHVA